VSDLPSAVLFDMDGLLVDSEHTWYAVETEVMAVLGGPWGPEHQAALVGGPLAHSAQYMLDLSGRSDVDATEVARMLLDGMVDHLRRAPVGWMPGAQNLLEEVGAAGVPRALVSSSSRLVMDAVLDAVGRGNFDVTVSSGDVERTKPHPDPYLRAAEHLGVAAGFCVALEDSAPGATSARAAGCVTVVVPSVSAVPSALADLLVPSLETVDLGLLSDLVETLRPR
jgi:HAD superfamily hydrolase (TIGR01509 family)